MRKKNNAKKKKRNIKLIFLIILITLLITGFINIININKVKSINAKENNETLLNNTNEKKDDFSTNTNQNSSNLLLVNKNNTLKSNYEPNDLVVPSIKFQSVGDIMVKNVRTDVAIALENLYKAAEIDGINLLAISGYRSYNYQETLYNSEVQNFGVVEANRYVAKPGQSEHQTGLAMDILSDNYTVLDEGFENTDAFKWLENNMSKYGFIIRYPKGKEKITGYGYEPWHLRYVGVSDATEIMNKGLTLEEYLNKN